MLKTMMKSQTTKRKANKLISLLLSVVFAFSLFPLTAFALEGDGSAETPYEIGTADELMEFAQKVNDGETDAYAVLTADIDLSGKEWTGIATGNPYTGVFDGKGFSIKNLTGSESLFKFNNGTIKNVQLVDVNIEREGGNLGAVVGKNEGTVFNCVSSGVVNSIDDWSVGGLVGWNHKGTIAGCMSSCTVFGRTAGGLIGSGSGGGDAIACVYMGTCLNPIEGDIEYTTRTDVFYRSSDGSWKNQNKVPVEAETAFSIVNRYIKENGGSILFAPDGTTYPAASLTFYDYDEDTNSLVWSYTDELYTELTADYLNTHNNTLSAGWYLVTGALATDSRVVASGDVRLVLADAADFKANAGIDVSGSSSFTVYAQSIGADMGSLTATAAEATGDAGIGSSNGQTAGAITINGGKITATGGARTEQDGSGWPDPANEKVYTGAGIGGGEKSACSTITINGGIVTASVKGGGYWNESNSAAIGNGGYYVYDYESANQTGSITINGGTVTAANSYNGAGIGGGMNQPIQSITINGGNIAAVSEYGAGIGAGWMGNSGTISISGGTIVAESEAGCGIGGGYVSAVQSVTITGGDITATSDRGAGIGSCTYQPTTQVVISGGRVTAISTDGGNGIGVGKYGQEGFNVGFSTGVNGTAVIIASSIGDKSNQNNWSGLIFEGNDGKIYGTNYTVDEDLTIPADKTLTIENGKTLTVADGATLTVDGALHMDEGGAYSGTEPSGNSIAYQVRWDTDDDGAVDDTTYVPIGQTPSHADGEKASTAEEVYTFSGWDPELVALTETDKFPVYTAQFSGSPRTYEVTLPTGEGFTVQHEGSTAVEYGKTFTFTVSVEKGYFTGENFAVKADGKSLTPNANGSYTVTVSDNVTITVEGIEQDAVMPVISGVTDGGIYYVTQSVTVTDDHLQSVTLNGVPVTDGTFILEGNKSETYIIVATDLAGNETRYTVTMKPASTLAQPIEGLTVSNVTSANKADIEAVKAQVAAVDTASATEAEKAALREITDTCDTLLERLEQASQAVNNETINKVEDITSDTVKPEDKDDLLAAKEKLEEALENFGGNYTQEEQGALEEKLEQIDSALDSIEKVEKLESDIAALPETAEPDDLETGALINAAKEQYDALTEHEKSMVSEQMKQKLEVLIADLTDYRVVDGNGGRWTVGSGESLTFTANGAAAKFTGLMVDGVAVDADHYAVRAGSTIVTLKAEYLNTLSAGKHTLTILYADGEATGEFVILAQNTDGGDTENETTENGPVTGDGTASAALWCVFAFAGVLAVLCYGIKKQYNR